MFEVGSEILNCGALVEAHVARVESPIAIFIILFDDR